MDRIEFLSILVVGLLSITAMILSIIGLFEKDNTAKDLGLDSLNETESFSIIELKDWLTNPKILDGINTIRGAIKVPVIDPMLKEVNTFTGDSMQKLNTYYNNINAGTGYLNNCDTFLANCTKGVGSADSNSIRFCFPCDNDD